MNIEIEEEPATESSTVEDAEVEPQTEDGEEHPANAEDATSSAAELRADDSEETRRFLKGILEALLFVAETPMPLKDLARAAKIDRKRTAELVTELVTEYSTRGIRIHEVSGGYCFRSSAEFSTYVRGHLAQRPVRLSRAQLETLAIVAYRQPITRPEVDDIRGVDSGPVLKGLLERDLIKILGKKDEPGRPMLYGTTSAFLELFNMHSLQDLPTLKEFTELSDDSRRRFEQKLGEDAPEGPIELAAAAASVAERSGGEFAARSEEDPDAEGPESADEEGKMSRDFEKEKAVSKEHLDEEGDDDLPRDSMLEPGFKDPEDIVGDDDDDDEDEDDEDDDDDDEDEDDEDEEDDKEDED